MSDVSTNIDEILEQRERDLLTQAAALGERIYKLQNFWQKLNPSSKRRRATLEVELLQVIASLDEVREVRRLLLGLDPQAHIRKRDIPNFVAQNPSYASVVACEHTACERTACEEPTKSERRPPQLVEPLQ